MISFQLGGSTQNMERFLRKMSRMPSIIMAALQAAGEEGVSALESATPIESGLAARSWGYRVTRTGNIYEVAWYNSDVENGFPVALRLQFGYGTGTGGYVPGRDYINPAMRPIFDEIADKVWKVVTSA